jgi:hypothetical protein
MGPRLFQISWNQKVTAHMIAKKFEILDREARKKIEFQKKTIPEGSLEWDILVIPIALSSTVAVKWPRWKPPSCLADGLTVPRARRGTL